MKRNKGTEKAAHERFYFSSCPETGRIFICEVNEDNNIAEVFARNGSETVGDNAQFICDALNKMPVTK